MTAKLFICVLLLPLVAVLAIACLWDLRRQKELRVVTCGTLIIMTVLLWYLAVTGNSSQTLTLFSLTDDFTVTFAADMFGRYFAAAVVTVWTAVMLFLSVCLESQKHETRFFICSILISCTLTGVSYAANFMTMFLFFEATIFLFFPLLMHYQTEGAEEAGRRYFLGAFLGGMVSLMGACCFSMYVSDLGFVSGGALDATFAGGKNRIVILISSSLMVAGFGLFSHTVSECGWLPGVERDIPLTVQAESAGIIANIGVFAAIRSVYHLVGADYLFGSGTQIFLLLFGVLLSAAGIFSAWRRGQREDMRLGRVNPKKTGGGSPEENPDGDANMTPGRNPKRNADEKNLIFKRNIYILLNQTGYAFLLLTIFQSVGLYLAIGYAAVHMLMEIVIPCYSLMKK